MIDKLKIYKYNKNKAQRNNLGSLIDVYIVCKVFLFDNQTFVNTIKQIYHMCIAHSKFYQKITIKGKKREKNSSLTSDVFPDLVHCIFIVLIESFK